MITDIAHELLDEYRARPGVRSEHEGACETVEFVADRLRARGWIGPDDTLQISASEIRSTE